MDFGSYSSMLPCTISFFNTALRQKFFASLGLDTSLRSLVTLTSGELQKLINDFLSPSFNLNPPRYLCNISDDDLLHGFFFLACRTLNCVYIPVSPAADVTAVLDILGSKDYTLIYRDGKKISTLSGDDNIPTNTQPEILSEVTNRTNDDALVIFTSGSTGKPKGVVHTGNSLQSSFINQSIVFDYGQKCSWLSSLPAFHIGGMSVITRASFSGADLFFPAGRKKEQLLEAVNVFTPSFFSLVPTQLQQLSNLGFTAYPQLKSLFVGGGPTDNALLFDAIRGGIPLVKCYGSSETASFITASSPEEFLQKPHSAGKPLPQVMLHIQSETGKIAATGTRGEVVITSPTLFNRYINNPQETSVKLNDRKYLSGDEGYLDDDGFLYLLGRTTRIIITGGENVSATEIESMLEEINGIKKAIVFGIPDIYWGEKIVAATEVNDPEITEEFLLGLLRTKLATYKLPKNIFLYTQFPVNELGKTDMAVLKKTAEIKS